MWKIDLSSRVLQRSWQIGARSTAKQVKDGTMDADFDPAPCDKSCCLPGCTKPCCRPRCPTRPRCLDTCCPLCCITPCCVPGKPCCKPSCCCPNCARIQSSGCPRVGYPACEKPAFCTPYCPQPTVDDPCKPKVCPAPCCPPRACPKKPDACCFNSASCFGQSGACCECAETPCCALRPLESCRVKVNKYNYRPTGWKDDSNSPVV